MFSGCHVPVAAAQTLAEEVLSISQTEEEFFFLVTVTRKAYGKKVEEIVQDFSPLPVHTWRIRM